jgi:excisionase family DNA binding protein
MTGPGRFQERKMLTTGEVAKLFHVSAQTVINWLDQGRMPYERIGRGPRRLTEEAVMRYVEEIGISPEALDEEIYARATKAAAAYRNATGPAVVVTDAELKVIAWNEASRTLYGHTQVEMLGKPLAKIVAKINGSDGNLDSMVKAPWQDKSLQIEAQQETRYGKQLTGIMTVSRFYMDCMLAGYVVACKEKGKK